MCLVTPTRKAYTAQADIYCYKILNESNGELTTPFRKFPMELGKIYGTEDVSEVDDNEIEEGFLHAYASPSYMYKFKEQYCNDSSESVAMYLAVIPKGAKFFVNNDCTEICATTLRVIQKIADIEDSPLFDRIATDVKEYVFKNDSSDDNIFDRYKDSLTSMESIVKFAKDHNLYADILHKYETFEEGSYEKNLYAYRLIVAVLTGNEKNSLTTGNCYYPYVRFYNGKGYYSPTDEVKIGTIIADGTSYIVVGGDANNGATAGIGDFGSNIGVSSSWTYVGFRSVSRRDVAQFISRHFGKIIFDLMYGCAGCDYRWADDNK